MLCQLLFREIVCPFMEVLNPLLRHRHLKLIWFSLHFELGVRRAAKLLWQYLSSVKAGLVHLMAAGHKNYINFEPLEPFWIRLYHLEQCKLLWKRVLFAWWPLNTKSKKEQTKKKKIKEKEKWKIKRKKGLVHLMATGHKEQLPEEK